MDSSKCIISTKTHSIVTFQGTNTPVVEEGLLLLYNKPANCVIRVPLTKAIKDMFKVVDKKNTNISEIDDLDSEDANNISYTKDAIDQCAGEPESQRIIQISKQQGQSSIERKTQRTETEETLTELLIAEYSKRPPLFNERLPLIERSRSIKKALELEVYEALNGQLTLEDIAKKWAYLKKEYKKQKSILHKYVKSGCSYAEAAKITGKTLWVHFLSLQFIDDHGVDNETVSNIEESLTSPPLTSTASEGQSAFSPEPNTSAHNNSSASMPPSKKRKHQTTEQTSAIDGLIMKEMQKEDMDSTDHFCKMLCLEMKKLNPRQRSILQIKYLELLYEAAG